MNTYNSTKSTKKKVSSNTKLQPLFSSTSDKLSEKLGSKPLGQNNSSGALVSPQSRSHYGKFPNGKVKGKIEAIKKSRGGSGSRNRKEKTNARLSPLPTKPIKKVPKH